MKNKTALEIKPFHARLEALGQKIVAAGMSREAFCREAGIQSSLWTRWAGGRQPLLSSWETVRTHAVRLLKYDPDAI
jgi:hypothetical protein